MSLSQQAMLANLTISQWTARKYDKTATGDVETKHGAKDAGRFNKLLIDKSALEPIAQLVGKLRTEHYNMTLPWGDNGDRLLPSKLYLQYTQEMRGLRSQFDTAVYTFISGYPALVQAARRRLGTLYDATDYPNPSDIASRFSMSTSFTPVPDAKDFRVDVAAEDAEQIRADITRMVRDRQAEATKDAFRRAKEVVTRVHDRLSADKIIIHESLMDNVRELIDMLPAFNLTDDPGLTQLHAELKNLWCAPKILRANAFVRESTAETASLIIQRMGWA